MSGTVTVFDHLSPNVTSGHLKTERRESEKKLVRNAYASAFGSAFFSIAEAKVINILWLFQF